MIFERDLGFRGIIARKLYTFYGAQDLIICQTERMLNSLNKNTKNRLASLVAHIPNPIDKTAISKAMNCKAEALPSLSNGARLIGWCGRLDPVKSPLKAIDTLDKLANKSGNQVHLVMIGEGQMRQDILSYAKKLGLSSQLTLTGRVAEPATILRHCNAGLMTSNVEGFPNVILEMLAAGIPRVVTTNCAGDLGNIPGVIISKDMTADSLSSNLIEALEQIRPHDKIDRFLQERNPGSFFQKILAV